MNRPSVLVLLAATTLAATAAIRAQDADEPSPAIAPHFEALLLQAAREYWSWPRVTDEIQFSPESCAATGVWATVQSPRLSASEDTSTHGRKLYYLSVKFDRSHTSNDLLLVPEASPSAYVAGVPPISPQPIGQTLVKESWTSVEMDYIKTMQESKARFPVPEHAIDRKAKRAFRAGEPRELFVMLKLDPATPETDNGWVYGVLTPDGKQVLQSGRIESCMECHLDAPYDRLFGLK